MDVLASLNGFISNCGFCAILQFIVLNNVG